MAQCGFTAGTTSIKKHVSFVPPVFQSRFTRTNLFKQGKISKGAKWFNCSVISRIARDSGFQSRSGYEFFLSCDIWWSVAHECKPLRTDLCTLLLVCHVAGHETSSRNDHSADHVLWSFGIIHLQSFCKQSST